MNNKGVRAVPIHFVGDSNTLVFHDLLLDSLPGETQPTVVRTSYCGSLQAAQFMSNDGALDPSVLYALLSSLVLVGNADSWGHQTRDRLLQDFSGRIDVESEDWGGERKASLLRPIVVFCIGSADCALILNKLGTKADFEVKSDRVNGLPSRKPEDTVQVPIALVRELIERAFAPLFRGLEAIRDSGVNDIFLHDLQPPSLDMEDFATIVGPYPVDLRYKLVIAINERLARFCRAADVAFIDLWDDVTGPDGLLDERFSLDYGHLNRRAAAITLKKIFSNLSNRRARQVDRVRQGAASDEISLKSSSSSHG